MLRETTWCLLLAQMIGRMNGLEKVRCCDSDGLLVGYVEASFADFR